MFSSHGVHVGNRPPRLFRRNLQRVFVIRFQKHTLRLHQPLPDCPVGCLPEVAPFGVLEVRPAGGKRNLHIGDGRAGQHPEMLFFLQMGKDQPLPVEIQFVCAAAAVKLHSAAPFSRFQQQMDLRVMPQRFKMADAFHCVRNGLTIEYPAGAEIRFQIKALG